MTRAWLFRILRGAGAAVLLAAVLGGLEVDIVLRTRTTEVLHALDRWKLWASEVLACAALGAVVGVPLAAILGATRGMDLDSRELARQTGRDPGHSWQPWVLGGTMFVVCAVLLTPWALGVGSPRPGPGLPVVLALAFILGAITALGLRVFIRRIDFTGRGQGIAYLGLPTALMLTMSFAVSAPMAGGKGTGVRAREGTPNVLLVTVDALRADHAGRDPRVKAPALRWLARDGATFTQAVTPSTSEVASAGAMLTGRHPLSTGLLADSRALPRSMPGGGDLPTLAELFAREGYATGAFVSSAAVDGAETGLSRGFAVYDDDIGGGRRGARRLAIPWARERLADLGRVPGPRSVLRPSAETVLRFGEWLDRHYRENLFVWLHLSDPRVPFIDPRAREGALVDPIPGEDGGAYGGRVATLDLVLEEMFRTLESDGLMDWTLVVVAGHRGWAPGSDARSVTESWLRVPWTMHGPGIPKGTTIDRQARLEDLPATLLSAAGFRRASLGDGRSLVPLLDGRDLAPVPAISVGSPRTDGKTRVSLRTPDSKLTRDPKGGAAFFDLRDDPREITDVAGKRSADAEAAGALLDETLGRFVPRVVEPPQDPERIADLRALEAAL